MKKILVITVLALFLALPVMAVTNRDFTANGTDGDTIATLTLNGVDTNLIIASNSKAMSLTINANGTLDIVNAATSTFKIYPIVASTVNVIKIASTTDNVAGYISCTTFTAAFAAPSGGSPSSPSCTSVVYADWQTAGYRS